MTKCVGLEDTQWDRDSAWQPQAPKRKLHHFCLIFPFKSASQERWKPYKYLSADVLEEDMVVRRGSGEFVVSGIL